MSADETPCSSDPTHRMFLIAGDPPFYYCIKCTIASHQPKETNP